jgi:hypothetical protein
VLHLALIEISTGSELAEGEKSIVEYLKKWHSDITVLLKSISGTRAVWSRSLRVSSLRLSKSLATKEKSLVGVGVVDLPELIARLANRGSARSEADVQADVRVLLLYGGLNLQDDNVRLETPAPNRRRLDVEVGSTVIEVKKDLRTGNVLSEGQEQLAGYVADRTRALGRHYIGILTDGAEWRLYSLLPDAKLVEVSSFTVRAGNLDSDRLCVWLESVLATGQRLAPTPLEIARRLGASSPSFHLDLAQLRALYETSRKVPEVRLKRELWARLLAAALGTHFTDDDELFIVHTYLVIVAKLIAHAAGHFPLMGQDVMAKGLVAGKAFQEAGIGGVVESDFFDWPVDDPDGEMVVTDVARRLARFDWGKVDHDVLKVLYESVIDAETRKRLGEYYTPDWLAERMVNEKVGDPLNLRVMDPACGSGTFLFWGSPAVSVGRRASSERNTPSSPV